MDFLTIKGVRKVFNEGTESESKALRGIDLTIEKEAFAVLSGPSGSGKSTLLNIIGGLDTPSAGTVTLEGTEVTAMDESDLALFRREHIGFVFQAYNLIPVLTVRENIS